MASSKSGRVGSATALPHIPHTRVDGEHDIENFYEFGSKLGQGSFGIVREVIHKATSSQWACKVINKEKAGSSAVKLLEREVTILKSVQHDHIIQLKEVFETAKKMYLVMELCEGGELADVLKEQETFNEEETLKIMHRLTSAVSYLHKRDMVHRDIKLENILLSRNPEDCTDNLFIKLTDFGLSVVKDGVGPENMMMDFCGTPMYMAPEIIDNRSYSEKCDIWAMGVIMFTLLCGNAPFQAKDEDTLYEIIKTVDVNKLFAQNTVGRTVSDEAKDCVRGMLMVDPAHRVTASELLDHPWITGKPSDAGPQGTRNVLELMKLWRNELPTKADDDSVVNNEGDDNNNNGAINGERERGGTPPPGRVKVRPNSSGSSGSRPDSSSSSNSSRKTKSSKEQSVNSVNPRKPMVRNSTDPSLLSKQGKANSGSGHRLNKSTTERDSGSSSKARTSLPGTLSPTPSGIRTPSSRGPSPKSPPSPMSSKKKR